MRERQRPTGEASRRRPASFEDAELIERINSGETESFGILVEKYQDRVFNTCWRICGHLEDARDVTQEVFLKAFDNIAAFRRESGFYTWIFRIAVNLAVSHRRKAKTRQTISLDQSRGALGSQAEQLVRLVRDESADDPSGSVAEAELHDRVSRALQELDDDHRAVVVLRDIEGLNYQEIGEILEIPPGTVKSRLHRARTALRDSIMPGLKRRQEQ